VLLLVALAAFFHPRTSAPLTAEQAWLVRAGPSLDALAADVAGGPARGPALKRDLRHLRSFGPPPEAAAAARWASAVQHIEAAEQAPGQAGSQLAAAGLDLVALSGPGPTG
jgi:hypothetical protein